MRWVAIAVAVAVVALAAAVVVAIGPEATAPDRHARFEAATLDNPEGCPAQIEDLSPDASKHSPEDPWGHKLIMKCGAEVGRDGLEFAVISAGPDGKEGTDDDLHSWDEKVR